MHTKLFNDFEPVTSKQWKNLIQFDLKGADYNDTLIWVSPENIKVKPFYHFDENLPKFNSNTKNTEFKITQDIFVHDFQKSVYRAKNSLARGAESLKIIIPNEEVNTVELLNSIFAENLTVYLTLNFLSENYIKNIDVWAENKKITVYFLIDVIGNLAKDGNWFKSQESDLKIIKSLAENLKNTQIVTISSQLYQNAGANITQQLALTLSHINEYFNLIPNYNKTVVVEIAVGTNYFFEIAKLRALRLIFDSLNKIYETNAKLHILAFPSKRNKTIYDNNTNMLRTTTECMSAILGGANAVMNLPYDSLFHKNNEFGDRIARNQLLILKEESYLDKVNNPADGTYYIEYLTHNFAQNALELFKKIEAHNGIIAGLQNGAIQKLINEAATKEQELFDSNKEVLLGTNLYANKADLMENELELFPFVKKLQGKKTIQPIIEKRLAEKLEQERLRIEKSNK